MLVEREPIPLENCTAEPLLWLIQWHIFFSIWSRLLVITQPVTAILFFTCFIAWFSNESHPCPDAYTECETKVFPEQPGLSYRTRAQRRPCPDLISVLFKVVWLGKKHFKATITNRPEAKTMHVMCYFGWKLSVSSRHHLVDKSFISLGGPGWGHKFSKRDTKEFIGLSGKIRKTEWICILSEGLCNRKQTAGQQQIRTGSSSLSLSQCSDTVQPYRQCLCSQRTVIGQECAMGRRPDTQALGKCSYQCLGSGISLGLPLHFTLRN